MKLELARSIAQGLVMALRPACERVEIAGSIRRGKPVVKDIEIVVVPTIIDSVTTTPSRPVFGQSLMTTRPASKLDAQLERMVQAVTLKPGDKDGERMKTFNIPTLDGEIKLDLFIVLPPAQWGVIFAIRTGPADFSQWLVTSHARGGALPEGLKIQGGQLWRIDNGIEASVPVPDEPDFFDAIGLAWVEPAKREARWQR